MAEAPIGHAVIRDRALAPIRGAIGRALVAVFALTAAVNVAAKEDDDKPLARYELEETVISGSQELPKVLYIVPWQDPGGMPTIKLEPEFEEHEVFRRLYPPAYAREIDYYEMLDASK
jgi:hypothetical protein